MREVQHASIERFRCTALTGFELSRATASHHHYAPHTHDEYVVQVVDSGDVAFEWDGRKCLAPAGSIILIDPGVVHTGAPASDAPVSYSTLYPTRAAFARARRDDAPPRFGRPVVRDDALARRIRRLVETAQRGAEALASESAIALTLGEVAARYGASQREASGDDRRRAVRRADALMHDRYAERLTLDTIADEAGVSPFYLVRAFRADMGITPHAHLSNIRVNAARRLLLDGLAPGPAALQVGFCDQSHLNRHFKRVFGVTPGRFQRAQIASK